VKNTFVGERAKADIDKRVERLLRGLGNPKPPINLVEVRELLHLDKSYYSGEDDGLLAETVNRLKLGGKQLLLRPSLLKDAIKKFDLRALYLPDRKRILLDQNVPVKKHRWLEAHEIIHDVVPWHSPVMLGDNDHTPTPNCTAKIEVEANYGAGQLLFPRGRFVADARAFSPGFEAVRKLYPVYGNTMTSTFWRYVELVYPDVPMLGLITAHPHVLRRPTDFDLTKPCRYFIQSPLFASQFSAVAETEVFEEVSSYCGAQSGGPLGEGEIVLTDDNHDQHVFFFETFFNKHEALTLGRYLRKLSIVVAV